MRAPADLVMRSQTVGPMLSYVRERGGAPETLISRFELPATVEQEAEVELPLALVHALYDAAAVSACDPFLGLNLARRWRRGAFGLLEFCCRTAPTVGAALSRLVRYVSLSNELVVVSLEHHHQTATIRHEIPGEPRCISRHGNEFFLSLVLLNIRAFTGTPWDPQRAWFAHDCPADTSELVALFGDRLEFGAGSNGLALDATLLDLPLVTADADLLPVLDRQAEQHLAKITPPEDFVGRLRACIRESMSEGAPSITDVARVLATSPRSLQRRLQQEGTSFALQVESVRKELAEAYVADHRMPIGEVAFRLGYGDTPAFLKAFKRWTGTTPGRFRARQ